MFSLKHDQNHRDQGFNYFINWPPNITAEDIVVWKEFFGKIVISSEFALVFSAAFANEFYRIDMISSWAKHD